MKSIYEASVAYGREHQGTVNIEDYQAGANYVLEEVKDILFRRYSDDGDLRQKWIDMKKLIKVLEM